MKPPDRDTLLRRPVLAVSIVAAVLLVAGAFFAVSVGSEPTTIASFDASSATTMATSTTVADTTT